MILYMNFHSELKEYELIINYKIKITIIVQSLNKDISKDIEISHVHIK